MVTEHISTPSEIQDHLHAIDTLLSELPGPTPITMPVLPVAPEVLPAAEPLPGMTTNLDLLQEIAAKYFGSHPSYQAFLQEANRSMING